MTTRNHVTFEAAFDELGSWYDARVSPLSSGGIGVWFRNINDRRLAEADRAALEERYRLVARATNDLVWDWDLLTDVIQWNDALGESLGYYEHQLGTTADWWLMHVHPEDRKRVGRKVQATIDGKQERFVCEYRFLKAGGTYARILDRGYVMRDPGGKALRFVGAMQDNTERYVAAEVVRTREAQLFTVFGQAMVGILQLGPDRQVLIVNERFCGIVGRTEEELKKCDFEDYTHSEDAIWSKPLLDRHWGSGEPFHVEKRFLRPDGSIVWCEVAVSFVRTSSGEVESCIVVAQDISSRKAAEEALSRQSGLLQTVVDSVADLIFVKDRSGKFILANRALEEGCGKLVGIRTTDVFDQELTPAYEELDAEVMSSGELRTVEEEIPIRGERRLFQTVKVPWVQDGQIGGIIGVSRDITERDAAERALRESDLLHRSVLEASADCIKIIDLNGALEMMNGPGACAMEIDNVEQILGHEWAGMWPEEARKTAAAAIEEARAGRAARFTDYCPTAKGTPKWWDVVVTPMKDEAGEVSRILSISRDITSSREAADQLRWTSEHDGLTDLPNRRSFQTHLQAATLRAMEPGGVVGLLLIDLDHFKHVNDTLGHAAGDHLLKTFSQRLQSSVRANDFVARLGGDEFAVILEGVKAHEDLMRAGESILQRLQAPMTFDGRVISASASIGGALFPEDASSANELFKCADSALYALKGSGRGGTRMFHNYMREEAQKVASQLSLARIALSEDSVVPHYQQKVELKSGKICGFEALLRWKHPTRGMQQPDTVAEAFKDYELASKIGELMQRKVFRDIRRWQRAAVDFGRVSINASPSEFLRDDYAEKLLARAADYQVPGNLVEVEVTEHVFLERSAEYVARALKMLNNAGVRLSLDDFGTGYSSLSHLRDFPVDVVKIDRSFIARMVDEPEIGSIVTAVIDLSASLSLDVVAEGIETSDQAAFLRERNCALGQGYLFGRAVVGEEVPVLLGHKRISNVTS
jgi:diguanylate cyclase (GGDEF)-like protein/PAS domain S-box-containing protein